MRVAECALVGIDRFPMAILNRLGTMIGDERFDRLERGRRCLVQTAGGEVFEQRTGGFDRILLVRTDYTARAALDPAGAVDAAYGFTCRVERASLSVGMTQRFSSNGTPSTGRPR